LNKLLLILAVALLAIGCIQRYSGDEVTENSGITVFKTGGTPVTGIVYDEYENGQLWQQLNYEDGGREHTWISLYSKGS